MQGHTFVLSVERLHAVLLSLRSFHAVLLSLSASYMSRLLILIPHASSEDGRWATSFDGLDPQAIGLLCHQVRSTNGSQGGGTRLPHLRVLIQETIIKSHSRMPGMLITSRSQH